MSVFENMTKEMMMNETGQKKIMKDFGFLHASKDLIENRQLQESMKCEYSLFVYPPQLITTFEFIIHLPDCIFHYM